MTQPLASDRTRMDEQLLLTNVVCMSLVLSVVIVAGVAYWLADVPQLGALPPAVVRLAAWSGVLVAAALLVAAPLVRRRLLDSAARQAATQARGAAPAESYRQATLLAFILREAAAVVGLMIAVFTGEPAWCYAVAAVAMVAMFSGWPRREELSELLAGAS